MRRNIKRVGAVISAAAAITVTAGVAFAFWTTDGAVSAEGATGSTSSFVTRDAVITPDLTPGNCSDIKFTLRNNNEADSPGIRQITKIDFGAAPPAQLYIRTPYIAAEGATANTVLITHGYDMQPIAGNGGDRQVTLPNAVCMTQDAPNEARGKSVTVNLTLDFKLTPGSEYTGS